MFRPSLSRRPSASERAVGFGGRAKRSAWGLAAAGALLSSLALARFVTHEARGTRAKPRNSAVALASAAAPVPLGSASVTAPLPIPVPSEPPRVEPTAAESPTRDLKPRSAFAKNLANRATPRVGAKPWLVSDAWRAQHERQLRSALRKTTQLVFVGDSITEAWGVAPAFREHFGRYAPLNLGIAGDTTQNVLWRIEHGALDGLEAKLVVLLIGVNNLGGGFSPQDTADGVRATVTAVCAHLPSARVLLLGILPARREAEHPLRQRILDTNRLLAGLVDPGHVEYAEIGSVLLDSDGRIAPGLTRDFLHPTAAGFERLSSALDLLLDVLLAPPAASVVESHDPQ
jgi:lysophospholipase L1-like esterase